MRCEMVRHRYSDVLPVARAGGSRVEVPGGAKFMYVFFEKKHIEIGEKWAQFW
jgi:hypothetical protein